MINDTSATPVVKIADPVVLTNFYSFYWFGFRCNHRPLVNLDLDPYPSRIQTLAVAWV